MATDKGIQAMIQRIATFCEAREWKQFHNPKDLALSLTLEASEVAEHFQWKDADQMGEYVETHREEIGDELADVLYWVLLMSNDLDIDIEEAFERKMKKNEEKYTVEKARGKHTKYNKL